MILTADDLAGMSKLPRVQLATTLPGPKPICLVGTRSRDGRANLAPFSSVTHLGSNPVLIGMVTRPDTVERQTLRNIIETGEWTLNHITAEIVAQAHQCSARYSPETSEFDATGLEEHSHDGIHPPFVAASPLRFALTLEEIIEIPSNGTKLIVGRVQLVDIPNSTLADNGSLDLAQLGSLASTALDTYFALTEVAKLPYAKASS